MVNIYLVSSVTDACIIVQSLPEKEISIGKNILNLAVGEYIDFGAQIGGKIRKKKLRKLYLSSIQSLDLYVNVISKEAGNVTRKVYSLFLRTIQTNTKNGCEIFPTTVFNIQFLFRHSIFILLSTVRTVI